MTGYEIRLHTKADCNDLEDAFSLWRRQIEARRTLGDVDIDAKVAVVPASCIGKTLVSVDTVVDILPLGTFAVLSASPALFTMGYEPKDGMSRKDIDRGWLYIPVFVPEVTSKVNVCNMQKGYIYSHSYPHDPVLETLQYSLGAAASQLLRA